MRKNSDRIPQFRNDEVFHLFSLKRSAGAQEKAAGSDSDCTIYLNKSLTRLRPYFLEKVNDPFILFTPFIPQMWTPGKRNDNPLNFVDRFSKEEWYK
ncbi:hypothetical protein NPIL_453661 [Nephila pilipes]|uniref:Uncharacterized protein n=1 Tax=Nephila pilipes TaxID=299642 RepID=A0A8X6NZF7_NEPPI|nr:hypothetical protein NPIL_453661 [Nephila pilipes]